MSKRKSPEYYDIPIEVPAHIEAFYKSTCLARIKIGRLSKLGAIILVACKPIPFGKKPIIKKPGKHYVDLIMNLSYKDRRQYIPDHIVPQVKALLREIYKDQFHKEVDQGRIYYGLSDSDAIRAFRNKYNITEEIMPHDSMYRAYQRYKTDSKEQVFNELK